MSASTVIPAHLAYLAIYNPTLGPTDESVRDQIVFYHSHKLEVERERQRASKDASGKSVKSRSANGQDGPRDMDESGEEAAENERLRQVGLAQGMVSFVKNFSNGVPLESVETEKSRVVLKEVESDWWILASIDLTQLPTSSRAPSSTIDTAKSGRNTGSGPPAPFRNVEYSSREVAPAPLLLAQLLKAYRGFLLHHASSLTEMWKKHERNRDLFCSLLSRYWSRFVWDWDVLLHGNPSVDLHNAVKLAGGAELGVGVGEEEWGSGEREVLEDFASRTEGLVDLVVGRYGDAPIAPANNRAGEEGKAILPQNASEPWLGNGHSSRAEDGIIFAGVGGVSKPSLITVSQWMELIYMYGDSAYGISENPSSPPRHRTKRRRLNAERPRRTRMDSPQEQAPEVHPRVKSSAAGSTNLRRKAMENNAAPPGIPPPLITAVERSLDAAVAKADTNQPTEQGDNTDRSATETEQTSSEPANMFNSRKMMKYLSLGYGSSWTLNPKGFDADNSLEASGKGQEDDSERPSESTTQEQMQELDPTPDVSDDEQQPYVQRLEESIGKFLIGLSGDLENTEFEDGSDEDVGTNGATPSAAPYQQSRRIFLRTLLVEMSTGRFAQRSATADKMTQPGRADQQSDSAKEKTSAGASVDGAQPVVTHERVQVAVYVHQPFVFVFLFQLHTPNLTMPAFYRAIHHTLGPLQKSLLRSTDPERSRERMRDTLAPASTPMFDGESNQTSLSGVDELTGMYDLLYDPAKSTIRSSIPNKPLPGSLAAEGLHRSTKNPRAITVSGSWYTLGIPIGSASGEDATSSSGNSSLVRSDWTRVEALNVHTHILNTWTATRDKQANYTAPVPNSEEKERTIKTTRGWWIVWTKIFSARQQESRSSSEAVKEVFLVRRSPQERSSTSRETHQSRSDLRSSSSTGRWLLREQPRSREVSGSQSITSGSAGSDAKGVTEGMGVDTKRWIDALARLSL